MIDLSIIRPNYLLILPELILAGSTLVVLTWDLFTGNKRLLAWLSLLGVLGALAGLWPGLNGQITAGDYFGDMLVADPFAFFMKGVLLLVAAAIIVMSMDFVQGRMPKIQVEYYELVLFSTLGLLLMVGSRNIAMIYVGLELGSQASYVLAGLLRKDPKSTEAAMKYWLNGTLASAVLLFGVSILYGLSGATYLPDMARGLAGADPGLVLLGMAFVVAGFGFKVSAAPFHLWAPDAYEGAPTPVTGYFSVGPKGAAIAAVMRIFLVALPIWYAEWMLLWAILAAASMLIGNLTALWQTNVKRMMAYSSIAQAGYMLVGMAGMVKVGGSGAHAMAEGPILFYILGYALANLGLFAIIVAVENTTGSSHINAFQGLGKRAPFFAWTMTFLFLSLIGIPPTVGFFAKFFLFRVAIDAGLTWLALLMALTSAVSVYYYYGIVRTMFFEEAREEGLLASGGLTGVVVLSALGVLLVGLLSNKLISYAELGGLLR